LTDEGAEFFRDVCAGRAGDAIIFARDDGAVWADSNQKDRMRTACERAKITPPIGFHGLRHTWASLSIMAGAPLLVVAEQLGHRDTQMVQRHYAHLAKSYVADAIRAAAPRFGAKPSNVRVLG
jgi:integrase